MIQLTPHIHIFLAVAPVDFRKGIDGLAGVCRSILKSDPFSGYVFIFRNKKATAIKILMYGRKSGTSINNSITRQHAIWRVNCAHAQNSKTRYTRPPASCYDQGNRASHDIRRR